jgi:hypothetical protein
MSFLSNVESGFLKMQSTNKEECGLDTTLLSCINLCIVNKATPLSTIPHDLTTWTRRFLVLFCSTLARWYGKPHVEAAHKKTRWSSFNQSCARISTTTRIILDVDNMLFTLAVIAIRFETETPRMPRCVIERNTGITPFVVEIWWY